MWKAMRAQGLSILVALPLQAFGLVEKPNDASINTLTGIISSKVQPVAADALDSPAQAAIKRLTKPSPSTRPLRVANAEKSHPDLITRLEEIRVYGRNEPEDFVGRKKSPMMQFRARLERDVTLSPAKKVQLALCLIGLCSNYGPDGIPVGDSPEARADARLYQSTTQLNAQFRGTLQ